MDNRVCFHPDGFGIFHIKKKAEAIHFLLSLKRSKFGTITANKLIQSRIHQGGAPIKNKNDFVTLKGIIIPADWDTKGNVLAIAISTHGEEEYLICNDDNGKKLYNFIQSLVKVRGRTKEVAGIKLIKVTKIEKCIGISDETGNSINS